LIIEALLGEGTLVNSLTKYQNEHIRICRPTGLSRQDAQRVLAYALQHLGYEYDVRQLLDLARFLFPYSFVPRRWRSSLFEHNAGQSTRCVCSSMLAASYSAVKFPVLPVVQQRDDGSIRVFQRNARLFTPSDFDYSPYFEIIKHPYLHFGDEPQYRQLPWDKKGRISNGDGDFYTPSDTISPPKAETTIEPKPAEVPIDDSQEPMPETAEVVDPSVEQKVE
jgi:hypothetical protein